MSATDQGQDPNLTVTAIQEFLQLRSLLAALLTSERYRLTDVVVGRMNAQELVVYDVPGPGAKRLLIDRQGEGGIVPVGNGVITPVCQSSEGRVGGLVTNSGTANVRLYLAQAGDLGGVGNALSGQAGNRPSTLLFPGGSFDFRLGNVLYGGEVNAVALAAGGQVDWATF